VAWVRYDLLFFALAFISHHESQAPSDPYVAAALDGLPITSVLDCGIDLWRNLEIDDDELMGKRHGQQAP